MARPRRSLAVLLLAATLCAPGAATAAPLTPATCRTAPAAFMPRLWSLLSALWAEAGCIIDPNGGSCSSGQSAIPTPPDLLDEGCGLDPDGRCHVVTQSSAPAPPAFIDEGCGIDPNGHCGSLH